LIFYDMYQGTKTEIADKICRYYNNDFIDIINVVYSVFHDDLFNVEPVHHAIVYYRNR